MSRIVEYGVATFVIVIAAYCVATLAVRKTADLMTYDAAMVASATGQHS